MNILNSMNLTRKVYLKKDARLSLLVVGLQCQHFWAIIYGRDMDV